MGGTLLKYHRLLIEGHVVFQVHGLTNQHLLIPHLRVIDISEELL